MVSRTDEYAIHRSIDICLPSKALNLLYMGTANMTAPATHLTLIEEREEKSIDQIHSETSNDASVSCVLRSPRRNLGHWEVVPSWRRRIRCRDRTTDCRNPDEPEQQVKLCTQSRQAAVRMQAEGCYWGLEKTCLDLYTRSSVGKGGVFYRVVVIPLMGKALFVPEELIAKPLRLRWCWDDDAQATAFPWRRRRWGIAGVCSAKPVEVTEAGPSAAMWFVDEQGLKIGGTRTTKLVLLSSSM